MTVISCTSCKACCCRLEAMLVGDNDIPVNLTERDRWGGWVMKRLDDGWCAALDRNALLCTIYERRPMICRDYQVGNSDCIKKRLLHTQPCIGSIEIAVATFDCTRKVGNCDLMAALTAPDIRKK